MRVNNMAISYCSGIFKCESCHNVFWHLNLSLPLNVAPLLFSSAL